MDVEFDVIRTPKQIIEEYTCYVKYGDKIVPQIAMDYLPKKLKRRAKPKKS